MMSGNPHLRITTLGVARGVVCIALLLDALWATSPHCFVLGPSPPAFANSASSERADTEPITFYKHIAPIVYQSCAPCHRPGEPGPFPLLVMDVISLLV